MIAKWYVPEPDSTQALRARDRFQAPSTLTQLHQLELENAWQLKVFRGEISTEAALRAAERLAADLESGVWSQPDLNHGSVFATALRLSRAHSASMAAPSLDILHVAAALELGERHFVTGDERQGRLAALAGLRVTPL